MDDLTIVYRAHKVGKVVRYVRRIAPSEAVAVQLERMGFTRTAPVAIESHDREAERADSCFEAYLVDTTKAIR